MANLSLTTHFTWTLPAASGVDATTFTGDNKGKFYHYADYGPIGIVVVFDAPFTGTVYFGSVRSAVNWLT